MRPNQEQELETVVYNSGNEELKVKVSVYNASTNQNGLVVYEPIEELDPSLKIPLNTILIIEEDEITVPSKSSKVVTAQLSMPEEEFGGIILGGLHFEKINDDEAESSQAVQIQNKYAYVIGVQLREDDHEVFPELHFNSIRPDLVNYRTAVVANIQNSEPVLISNLDVHASIYKNGESDVLHEKVMNKISMAPNSNLDVVIDWKNQRLEQGTYRLKLTATTEQDQWQWEEEFTIDEEAVALNTEAVELEEPEMNWYLLGIISLSSIIVILLVIIIRLKKRVGKE
ncbi:DUF3324 domain-containing protein [Bacillus sp. B15-48]|nr:DUF3324 domain-containing protein [Bacillus sp. B15-48]